MDEPPFQEYENIEYDYDDNDPCQIDNTSIDDKKENTEWRKRALECDLENTHDIEIHNYMTCIHGNKVNKSAK